MTDSGQNPFSAVQHIRWWQWLPILGVMIPVMTWSSWSIFDAVKMLGISAVIAWVPAAALDGVMMLLTPWAVNDQLDREIRVWCSWVVTAAITGSVAVGFVDHYLSSAATEEYKRILAGCVGAIPNAMAALVVHILNKVVRQQSRDNAELIAARAKLDTAKGVLAEVERVLAQESILRQDAADEDVAVATRTRQAVAKERGAAATEAATAKDLRSQAEADRDAARVAVDEKKALVAELEKEKEKERSRRRRATGVAEASQSVSRPVSQAASQPVARDTATVSHATSTPAERLDWAVERLRNSVETTPADIDRHFGRTGSSRDGARILRKAEAKVEEMRNVRELHPRAASGVS